MRVFQKSEYKLEALTLEEEFDPFAETETLQDHPTTDKVGKKSGSDYHDGEDDAPVTKKRNV